MAWVGGRVRTSAIGIGHAEERALDLQEGGLDTVDANRALGFPDDCREYTSVHNILRDLGIKSIRLMVRFHCTDTLLLDWEHDPRTTLGLMQACHSCAVCSCRLAC